VLASATHIRQILMNLIINASEAIGDKPGKIEISTSRVDRFKGGRIGSRRARVPLGDYVRLLVSDTCSGTKPEARAPYFTTKPHGRGLGLAVIQTVIGGYGGFIRVDSAPGQGSQFEIMLPAARDRQNRSARTARAL
jgi:signal transduction histidine kinase